MRIMYIGAFRLPNFDAAAARVLNVARALRISGHDISFISWGGEQRPQDKCDDGLYRVDGIPYVVTDELGLKGGLFAKAWGWLTRGRKTKKILRQTLGQYDVIITYNCTLIWWLQSFCKKNKIYLVTDLTEWYDNNEQRIVEKPGYYFSMNYVQPRVKNKIVISSYLGQYFSKTHNLVVPAMCDASEPKWNNVVSVVEEFDGISLIYAGNPAKKDAVHFVIRAVQRLVNEGEKIRFLILGVTREIYINRYKDLLPNQQLSKNICFLGRVSQDVVPSYYAAADFMVLLREQTRKNNAGFPTKFAESFTSGTPVIANLTSDLKKYLKDGVTGFVVEEPSEEAIYRVLKNKVAGLDRSTIEQMKKNVNNVAMQFDYHMYVEPLKEFVDNLELQ